MNQEPLALVRSMYEAFTRGDLETILAGFAADGVWQSGYPAGTPLTGSFAGRDGIARFVQAIGQSLEIRGYEARRFIAQGPEVVVVGWERVVARETGAEYENPWVHVWTVAGGAVTRVQGFNDTAAIARGFRVGLEHAA